MKLEGFVAPTLALINAFVFSGCNQGSVVTPTPQGSLMTPTAALNSTVAGSQAMPEPGSFVCELSFQDTNRQQVSSLPAGEYMIFDAYVRDSGGSPATGGLVTLEACKLQGKSAASDACVNGRGHWERLRFGRGAPVITAGANVGHVFAEGETSQVPATRGYRFEYFVRGGGIPDGVSPPTDFTWF